MCHTSRFQLRHRWLPRSHRNGRFVWVWIKKCGIYHGFSLLDRLVKRKSKPEKYDGGGLEILPERSANLWTWTIVDQIDLSVEL